MAITARVGLSVEIEECTDCTELKLEDTTGDYDVNDNPLGYGLPGGIAKNDVTQVIVELLLHTAGTSVAWTFTVSSGTITAASMVGIDGVTYNVLSELDSTDWPFDSTNKFDLLKDYGAGEIELLDGRYEVNYTVSGDVSDELFDYTTSDETGVICNVCKCYQNLMAKAEPDCECWDKKKEQLQDMEMYISIAAASMDISNDAGFDENLIKAQNICDNPCQDC